MNLFQLEIFALATVVGVVLAAPQNTQDIQLLKYYSNNDGLGSYSFGYEQSDGSNRNEIGELRNAGAENAFVAVKGSYSWVAPDDTSYIVTFIADDKGYRSKVENRSGFGGVPTAVVASLLG